MNREAENQVAAATTAEFNKSGLMKATPLLLAATLASILIGCSPPNPTASANHTAPRSPQETDPFQHAPPNWKKVKVGMTFEEVDALMHFGEQDKAMVKNIRDNKSLGTLPPGFQYGFSAYGLLWMFRDWRLTSIEVDKEESKP